jgi:ABC-2 type transport system permease protein
MTEWYPLYNFMKRQLKQAWVIVSLAWIRNLNYRFTVLTYRVGEMAEVLVLVLMWTAIYSNGAGSLKGFTLEEMVTYVLIGNLFQVATRNFLPLLVSRDISEGRLSMYLVRPISYIKFIFLNEMGRIFLATILSIGSQILIISFFMSKIIFNSDPRYLLIICAMIFLAFITEMLIGLLVSFVAFWTDETDGIQASADRLKRFFSGGYFPLSLLPATLASASAYLPFGYSFFVPAQLYLKKMDLSQGAWGLLIELVWIALLSLIVAFVWKKGLRKYEATGS